MTLNPVQTLKSHAVALGLVALFLLIGVWLMMSAETTINKRLLMVPHIKVSLENLSAPAGVDAFSPSVDGLAGNAAEQPADIREEALSTAPLGELTEKGPFGILPVISADGREPWRIYARPFTSAQANRPQMSVVLTGLGLQPELLTYAIRKLPANVTFSLSPYAPGLQSKMDAIRSNGHEVLIEAPLETLTPSTVDQGTYEMKVAYDATENLDRLKWVLSRGQGFVGVVNLLGDKFIRFEQSLKPVLSELANRGILFIDNGQFSTSETTTVSETTSLKFLKLYSALDEELLPAKVETELAFASEQAVTEGVVIVHARATPMTIDTLVKWVAGIKARNIELVPVSHHAREKYPAE